MKHILLAVVLNFGSSFSLAQVATPDFDHPNFLKVAKEWTDRGNTIASLRNASEFVADSCIKELQVHQVSAGGYLEAKAHIESTFFNHLVINYDELGVEFIVDLPDEYFGVDCNFTGYLDGSVAIDFVEP